MACNKSNCNNKKCCCKTNELRYQGPPIPEIGIDSGELLESVIGKLSEFIIGGVATSTLDDNGDGTFTHTPGDESGTSTTVIVGKHTTGATPHLSPHYGDTWFDTGSNELKIYTNNGSIDIWRIV